MLGLSPNVVLRFEPQFFSIFAAFDYKRITTKFYNKWEFDVLDQLARRPSNIEDLRASLKVDKDRLIRFIDSQIQSRIIIESDRILSPVFVPPKVELDEFKGFPYPFLSAPSTVDIFLTRTCNLRCSHCYSDGGRPLRNEITFDEWVSVLDQLEGVGVLEVRLNGGEPFMYRRIYNILSYLKQKRYRKVMLTNGTLLDDRAVDALLDSEVTPTLSLDGATAQIHDRFRGVQGAFRRTLKAMQLLQKKCVRYGLNTCVHSENIGQIEEIIRLACRYGAERIGLMGLVKAGRLVKTGKNIVSGPEYLMLGLKVLQLTRKYRGKIDIAEEIISDELPLQNIGIFTCSIDSDGGVYPANRVLGQSSYKVGNVIERPLRQLWFSRCWIPFRSSLKKLKTLGLEQVH